MPQRDIGLWFSLDTNRINARQRDSLMNQLERWAANEVIHLYMSEPAAAEARRGGSPQRHEKISQFGPIMLTWADTTEGRALLRKIAGILFGRLPKDENELHDIEIVFNAKKYSSILITEDGNSKNQPKGILGNRAQLKDLGIDIWRTDEAVEFVRKRIELRDSKARKVTALTGEALPQWVGKD